MFINFWKCVASIVITCKSVNKRSRTSIRLITLIMTFSLNLGTSNQNFETTKYSLKRSFQKEWECPKKFFFQNFSESHCVLTAYLILHLNDEKCQTLTLLQLNVGHLHNEYNNIESKSKVFSLNSWYEHVASLCSSKLCINQG